MKLNPLFTLFVFSTLSGKAQPGFDQYPVYRGADLGLTYSPRKSSFRIWAPTASEAELIFYNEANGGMPLSTIKMEKSSGGTWSASAKGDQNGKYYVFRVRIGDTWKKEVPDPYARIVGVNGRRARVGDIRKTNPDGWDKDKSPAFSLRDSHSSTAVDAVIYELHVRDASMHISSGISQKGKFVGLTEKGTKNDDGLSTGLDHLKELGVTHIHLLPCYDFYSVDETRPDSLQYNWGYDPLNYNTPEGSYSTDARDGLKRIREFKQLIQVFHENGLRVVMDVVYNHTMLTEDSYFNQLVPGYYYRQSPNGKFSNATACGNETASERAMMRKFMLESVKYWVQEFHVDGFRFDLMGVHDIETMNLISRELHKIKPDILLYGEGWTAGSCPLPDSLRALKKNAFRLKDIAVFSDDLRDGIKGSVFDYSDGGFASGKPGMEETIKFGILAACKHPQVKYERVNYSKAPYASQPSNTISYCECHDNHVLWDKLIISSPGATVEERRSMHKLALSIVLSSQGISFLHAGTEFLRSKKGHENSYNSGDSINAIDWNLKTKNKDVFDYVKMLVEMRKKHPAFRMTTAKQIAKNIFFVENLTPGLVAYTIDGLALGDSWKKIFVVFNGNGSSQPIAMPAGKWQLFIRNNSSSADSFDSSELLLAPYSCNIFFRK